MMAPLDFLLDGIFLSQVQTDNVVAQVNQLPEPEAAAEFLDRLIADVICGQLLPAAYGPVLEDLGISVTFRHEIFLGVREIPNGQYIASPKFIIECIPSFKDGVKLSLGGGRSFLKYDSIQNETIVRLESELRLRIYGQLAMLASFFTSEFPNRTAHDRGKIVFGLASKRRVPENMDEPEVLVSVQGVQFKQF